MAKQDTTTNERNGGAPCATRREFLLTGGTAGAFVLLAAPGLRPVWAKTVDYPRRLVGKLSQLEIDVPMDIEYPDADSPAVLVKLGVPAGGGVGGDADIVSFSTLCTHMGGALDGTYKAKYKGLGPCPLHLTTFDLTRHGIVVAGHATESLPQVLLEVKGDEIFATGVMGLIYGRAENV